MCAIPNAKKQKQNNDCKLMVSVLLAVVVFVSFFADLCVCVWVPRPSPDNCNSLIVLTLFYFHDYSLPVLIEFDCNHRGSVIRRMQHVN